MDFSRAEHFAAHFEGKERDHWQKPHEVISLLALQPGHTVADLGAGTGYFEPYLSAAVGERGRVIALDAEQNMVAHLGKRAREEGFRNVEAKKVPYDDPTLSPSSVDRILIVNTWHHIDAREAYTRKLAHGLRPGGFVLIVDFTRDSKIGPPPRHRITADQVVRELAAGGLTSSVAQEQLPNQYAVIGRREPLRSAE